MSAAIELDVVHESAYRYAARVELAHHLGYLHPLEADFQSVQRYELAIEPEPSHQASGRDVYGNSRVFFSFYAPHEALHVRARSRVRVTARFDDLDPDGSAPWEAVQAAFRYTAGAPFISETEFAFASPFVPIHAELREYALVSFPPGRPLATGAIDLMHRIHAEFKYAPAATEVSTPVLKAFTMRSGVCQDFAHVMIGCLRALGLAARYVSGYLLTRPPPGRDKLQGADASHAWVSVHCGTLGWIDLDPTNDLLAGTSHVTLAHGRDYGDVMPLRGVIRGGGAHTLAVSVEVTPAAVAGA